MQHVRRGAFEVSETAEQRLKNIALVFGLLSVAGFWFLPLYDVLFIALLCDLDLLRVAAKRTAVKMDQCCIFLPLCIRYFPVFLAGVI